MEAILSVIVGFLLTGLIGNRLIQRWQARNWFLQQRFLGQEKEYIALRELADEIAILLGARIYRMRRLAWAIPNAAKETIDKAHAEYDEILKRWNERLPSFFIRLPMLGQHELAQRLEATIQHAFVDAGRTIQELRAKRDRGGTIRQPDAGRIEKQLNVLQGRSIEFSKALLRAVHANRVDVYFGKRIPFTPYTFEYFSTWQLVKALFTRDIDTLSILRTPIEP